MPDPSLYETLNIPRNATRPQIRAAYRTLSKTLHPDNPETGNRAAFERLTLAHDVLTDELRRQHYDATGEIQPTTPDNSNARALELVAGAILKSLQEAVETKEHPLQSNILEMARKQLRTRRHDIATQIAALTTRLTLQQAATAKFTTTAERDPVRDLLTANSTAVAAAIAVASVELSQIDDALGLLANYTFTPDLPPPPAVIYPSGIPSAATFTFTNLS